MVPVSVAGSLKKMEAAEIFEGGVMIGEVLADIAGPNRSKEGIN